MLTLYAAGPITGLSFDSANKWRIDLIDALRGIVRVVSPLRGKDYLSDTPSIPQVSPEYHDSTQSAIVQRALFDIDRCDIFLVNLLNADEVSTGTMIEYGWASLPVARKAIITVMEPESIHDNSFIRELSGWIVPRITDAIDIVKTIAAPYIEQSPSVRCDQPKTPVIIPYTPTFTTKESL